MALLFMDTTAAMNFLANQAGENTFTLLSPDDLDESLFSKPLPMLPIEPSPTRKLVAPPPSPSLLAMQKHGLEKTSSIPVLPLSGSNPAHTNGLRMSEFPSSTMPFSPAESSLSRSSSVYSSDSAISLDSLGSGDTSIAHIVEMYTDLINQIPCGQDGLGIQLLEPKAYRDTVAPLMQKRFNNADLSIPPPDMPAIPALHITKSKVLPPSKIDHKPQAGVQPFLRKPVERKSELVSPLSESDRNGFNLSNLDELSEPSPESSHTRPFSFTSEDIIAGKPLTGVDVQAVSHTSKLNQVSTPTKLPPPPQSNDPLKVSNQTERNAQQLWVEYQQRYLKPQDFSEKDLPPRPTDLEDRDSHLRSNQNYLNHSAGTGVTESIMIFNGVNLDPNVALPEGLGPKRDANIGHAGKATATRKSPASRSEPYSPNRQFNEPLLSTPKIGTSLLTQKRSTDPTGGMSMTRAPRKVIGTPVIPSSTYQKFGVDARAAESKQRRKEERKREVSQPYGAQPLRRPSSDAAYHSRYQKPTSAKSATLEVQSSPHARKNSFLTAIGGAKLSLTQSTADKRREKLKESIVVVGATHMSISGCIASPRHPL